MFSFVATSGKAGAGVANTKMNRRAQRTGQAIITAAFEILTTEGVDALTHQRVAEVAGIGRATVYRHWTSMDDLIFAVFDQMPFPFLEPGESGTLTERLRRNVAWIGAGYSSTWMKPFLLSVAERAPRDDRYRKFRDGLVAQSSQNIAKAIQDAPPDIADRLVTHDAVILLSMLLGPLWFRSMIADGDIDDTLVDLVVDSIFRTPDT